MLLDVCVCVGCVYIQRCKGKGICRHVNPPSPPTPTYRDVLLPHPYPQHMQLPIFPSYLPLRGRAQFPPPPGSQTVVMGMSSHGHTHGHPQLHPRGMWPPLHQGGPLMAHPPPRQGMPHPFVPPHPPPPGFMMRFPPMAHGEG